MVWPVCEVSRTLDPSFKEYVEHESSSLSIWASLEIWVEICNNLQLYIDFLEKKSLLLLHTDVGHLTSLNVLLNHPSDRILQQCINSTLSCIWASRISSHGSLYLPFLRQGLDNFSYIKKYIWIRRPIPGILTSNPVHGRISKTANVEKILMASLERIPCFHGLQRFLQPPWSSPCLSPHFCWRIHIKAKYLTRFLCLTNFLIKPKSSFPFSYRRFMCLPKGTICPWVFGSSKPPALILIV